jgi:acyl dehydratase
MANSFKRAPDNQYFEDYILGTVHELGSIKVDEQEVIEFGKRYVPLSYHVDKDAAKNSIYGGVIASGWHTAALMMRVYSETIFRASRIWVRLAATSCAGTNRSTLAMNCRCAPQCSMPVVPSPVPTAASCARRSAQLEA